MPLVGGDTRGFLPSTSWLGPSDCDFKLASWCQRAAEAQVG